MSTVLVYRVEDSEGKGPYYSTDPWIEQVLLGIPDPSNSRHPIPSEEGLWYVAGLVCGFESKESAIEWFSEYVLFGLEALGQKLYGYRVPIEAVQYGVKQVVFDPSTAVQKVRVEV